MGKKLTDAKREAIKRYDAANTRQVHLKLNCKTDADIIEHLEKQESIQGYIKDLIRVDMDGGLEYHREKWIGNIEDNIEKNKPLNEPTELAEKYHKGICTGLEMAKEILQGIRN